MFEDVPQFQTPSARGAADHQHPWQGVVPVRVVEVNLGGNANLVRCVRASRDYDGATPGSQATGARSYAVYVTSAKAVGNVVNVTLVPGGTPAKHNGVRVHLAEAAAALPAGNADHQILEWNNTAKKWQVSYVRAHP